MPWQATPGLIIIGGAFAVIGLVMEGADRLFTGTVSEVVRFKEMLMLW
jgi:hypothetical protein